MKHTEREKGLLRREKPSAGEAEPLVPFAPVPPLAERYLFDPYGVVADIDRQFERLRRNMESMLVPAWGTLASRPFLGAPEMRVARADFRDTGDTFAVELEMPGFARDNIEIDLTPDKVSVVAKREQEEREEHRGERYLAHERVYATLRRSFTFPQEVVPQKATAELVDGVLKLSLPKREPTPPPKSVKLKVK